MPFFTKDEILTRMQEKRQELGNGARADMNLALMILGSALFEQRLRSNRDYGEHPVIVGMANTRSNTKRIIGILHDVVEDSDWTLDDLRAVGFSERIVSAVDAMTHRDNELYFDGIERCSLNADATDKKIEDLSHNMDMSRTDGFMTQKDSDRTNKYKVAKAYLVAVKKNGIVAGSSIVDFAAKHPVLSGQSGLFNVLAAYSTRTQTAPVQTPKPAGP